MQTLTMRRDPRPDYNPYAKQCEWCKGYFVPLRHVRQAKYCCTAHRMKAYHWRKRETANVPPNFIRKIQLAPAGSFFVVIPAALVLEMELYKGSKVEWSLVGEQLRLTKVEED